MCWKLPFLLLALAANSLTSQAQVTNIWQIGMDDNGWPVGDGGGPFATFVAETGGINALPGVPNSPETDRLADNDYYLSGVFTTTIPSVVSFYGAYTPIGVVAANEEAAERAFAAGDLDLRYHFNLSNTLPASSLLSVTFDANNLDTGGGTDPRFGVEIYFNAVLVMSQVIIRPAQFDQNFTTAPFTQASVNAVRGPGADNIVSLRGISYNSDVPGGGNWMGVDFVQLDSQAIPEPSSALMIVCGALAVVPFLRRRR